MTKDAPTASGAGDHSWEPSPAGPPIQQAYQGCSGLVWGDLVAEMEAEWRARDQEEGRAA